MNAQNSSRRAAVSRRAAGFTLVEVIVVVIIIGVLAAVIGQRVIGRVGQSKHAAATANAATLANAVKLFASETGKRLEGGTLEFLVTRPSDVDPANWHAGVDNADQLKDPWGRPYRLEVPGQKNVDFDIVSLGADGKPGGDGENADIRKP